MHLACLLITSLLWTTPILGLPQAQPEKDQNDYKNRADLVLVAAVSGAYGGFAALAGNAALNKLGKTPNAAGFKGKVSPVEKEILDRLDNLKWIHARGLLYIGKCIDVIKDMEEEMPWLINCILDKADPLGLRGVTGQINIVGETWNRHLDACAADQGLGKQPRYYWHPSDICYVRSVPPSSSQSGNVGRRPPPKDPKRGNPSLNSKLEDLKDIVGGAIRDVQNHQPAGIPSVGGGMPRLPAFGAL